MAKTKGAIRAGNRSMTASGKSRAAEARHGRLEEPRACERCGAVWRGRAWHPPHAVRPSRALLDRTEWTTCPACKQQSQDEYMGRIIVRGDPQSFDEPALRRRVRNVGARAEFTQPERRIVSVERQGDTLEILTTSQKLAHRVVHEIVKAFGGRATYRWLDDGSLYATWRAAPARAGASAS
jgi:NMD protein affecting ribosome stability and mRNA decay